MSSASTDDSGVSSSFEPSSVGGKSGPSVLPEGSLGSRSSSEYTAGAMMVPSIAQSELVNSAYTVEPPMPVGRALETLQQLRMAVFLSDNLQHKMSEVQQVAGPTRFSNDAPLPSCTVGASEWNSSAHSGGISAPAHPSRSKHHRQHQHPQLGSREAFATWPRANLSGNTSGNIGSKPCSASAHLLYNMFSKTEDGTQWQCVECKRLLSSQTSLRAHARIHTGERPYQCQYCFRTFCHASTRQSHERRHTGEKPYKCEHCGRAFTQHTGLRYHLKTHLRE